MHIHEFFFHTYTLKNNYKITKLAPILLSSSLPSQAHITEGFPLFEIFSSILPSPFSAIINHTSITRLHHDWITLQSPPWMKPGSHETLTTQTDPPSIATNPTISIPRENNSKSKGTTFETHQRTAFLRLKSHRIRHRLAPTQTVPPQPLRDRIQIQRIEQS